MSPPVPHNSADAPSVEAHLRRLAQLVLEQMAVFSKDRERLQVETKRGPQDLVTNADRAIEAWLFEVTSAAFPEDGFLGEEQGWRRGPTGRRDWVVDPIDGTTNFANGLPWCCCSVGVLESGEPVAGLVVDPSRRAVYLTAGADRLSEQNGLVLHVKPGAELAGMVVLVEFPVESPAELLTEVLSTIEHRGAAVRVMGASALALAAVAAGQAHATVQLDPRPWDVAAGIALVQNAGGVVLGRWGDYTLGSGGPLIAGNAAVAEVLRDVVVQHVPLPNPTAAATASAQLPH